MKKERKKIQNYARFSGLTFQMIGIIAGGTYLGYWIDEGQGNKIPVWTLLLSLTSIGAALYHFIREASR